MNHHPKSLWFTIITEYSGALDSYSFKLAETLREIPIFNDTVISTIPNQTITIEKDSILRFIMKGNAPPEAQSDSMPVNAYTTDGKPVKVLEVAADNRLQKTSFTVDLNEGKRVYPNGYCNMASSRRY